MNKPFWPLAINSWGEEEKQAAREVIDSGHLTMGEKVKQFEEAFAKYIGSQYAVMVNSGSSANLLAIATILAKWQLHNHKVDITHGYEAIVPAIAWSTTYAPLVQHGFRLRVVDVDLETLNMGVEQVKGNRWNNTRLLIGVSVLGNPAPLDQLRDYAAENGLWFIEDNCESMGATINGKYAGTFGIMGTFSTFFSHHLNTIEGGILVTDDPELYDIAVCLRAHGWTRNLAGNTLKHHNHALSFDAEYCFLLPGYNLRPTEIAAAVGLVQLQRLNEMNLIRLANTARFTSAFAGNKIFITQRFHGAPVPFGFTLIAKTPEARAKASEAMTTAGIEHRLITGGCFARHPAAKYYDYTIPITGLPNAVRAHDCGFFVGNHAFDLSEQIKHLKEILK